MHTLSKLQDYNLFTSRLLPRSNNKLLKMKPLRFSTSDLTKSANRPLKTLVITSFGKTYSENFINSFSLASKPSMKQLKIDGAIDLDFTEYDIFYPFTNLTEKNCLKVKFNKNVNLHEIIQTFPAVTDFKYIVHTARELSTLIALLQHQEWAKKLTHLTIISENKNLFNDSNFVQAKSLLTAINSLPVLQCLVFNCDRLPVGVPHMTIFSQLKTLVIECEKSNFESFLFQLSLYAENNTGLQVHLLGDFDCRFLLYASLKTRSHIVRLGERFTKRTNNSLPFFWEQLPSLISLDVKISWEIFNTFFEYISMVKSLVHLEMILDFANNSNQDMWPYLPLKKPLLFLRAFDLHLNITEHFQAKWVKFNQALPSCENINIRSFNCSSCDVYYEGDSTNNEPSILTLACVHSTLPLFLTGIHTSRIILGNDKLTNSLEQLLWSFPPTQ